MPGGGEHVDGRLGQAQDLVDRRAVEELCCGGVDAVEVTLGECRQQRLPYGTE